MSSTKAEPGAASVSRASAAPTTPRDASTVVLLRDGTSGVEVFLVQRASSIAFMGGLHVFPGGKLDEADLSEEACRRVACDAGSPAVEAFADAVSRKHAHGLAVTAVRETLEEAGVLLGVPRAPAELAEMRRELLDGADFAELLERHALQVDVSPLVPLARWITPAQEPRRYDTRFYAARAPDDQLADSDARETVACRWLTPAEAVRLADSGALGLAPPTLHTLEELAPARDVDAALGIARSRPPPVIEPLLRNIDGEWMVIYPGDPEHPIHQPAILGPTRRPILKR